MTETFTGENLSGILQCYVCGDEVERLHTNSKRVRSLSLGRTVQKGELVCDRCLLELEKEYDEEEALRGPSV
jgi:transcription elongation factor Elf1